MKKIKFLIASMIGAIALVFACVIGTRVNAATGSYVDNTYDSDADNTGWTYTDVSTSTVSTWDDISVGQLPSTKSIYSPSFTNAQTVVVTIYCGTKGSNNGCAFKIRGYDGTTQVAEVTSYTPKSKALGQACTDANGNAGTFTLNAGTNVINKIEIYNAYSKGICFQSISYSTTDAVSKSVKSISAVNSTDYYVGETFNSSGFTVTATYSDDSVGTLLPAKYTTTVKDSSDNDVTGAFESAGNYVATIVLNDDNTISTTCNFTVSTYYTVKYYVNGSLDKTDSAAKFGSAITYVPSAPSGKYFYGWCLDEELNNVISSNYEVQGSVELYAKFADIKNYINTEEAISSSMLGSKTVTGFAGSIFNLTEINVAENTGMTLPSGEHNTYRMETTGSSSATRRNISFTAPFDGRLVLWIGSSNDGRSADVYKGSWGSSDHVFTYTFQKNDKNVFLSKTVEIEEGATYVIGGSNGYYIYGLFVEEVTMATDTTASVFAEKNTTTNTLRFVGTITGISNLSDIDTIELVLLKGDKATDKQIFLTTCFTAVTGTTQTCEAATGTYYVVYRISGISAIAGSTISKKLIVTFTDGSQTTCDATTINV